VIFLLYMNLKYPCNCWKPFNFIAYENVVIKQTQLDEIKWFVFLFCFSGDHSPLCKYDQFFLNHIFHCIFNTNYIIFRNGEIFKKLFFPNQKNIVKDNSEYLGIFPFVQMKISKLINYSTIMCGNGQGIMVIISFFILCGDAR
jgi:hypothetical protein